MLAVPDAWANEPPAADMAVMASSQVAVLEPVHPQPDSEPLRESAHPGAASLEPASSLEDDASPETAASSEPGPPPEPTASLEPVLPESALEIDLARVRDMDSIVDEARKQAQVEYLAEKLRKPARAVEQYVQLAWEEAGRRAGLSPELLIAIMHKESTFQPKVQSGYGAQGLMQVVRRWHREKLHAKESLFDPVVNIRVGTDILEEYLELAGGDLLKALAKYSGDARGYAKTIINESRKLAQVADTAAAEVAMAPWLFESPEAEQAG